MHFFDCAGFYCILDIVSQLLWSQRGKHLFNMDDIDGETKARKDINNAWALQLNGTDAMADYQKTLHCCGINNSTDYIKANRTIPNSCFIGGDYDTSMIVYSEGCLLKLIAIYEAAEHWVTIFLWSSFIIEPMAFISACILAITFKNQQRRDRYYN
ncbi:hypothetical protein DOY81_012201 [Sarcophaga bullata]|nr:hypothetical protein DOY81_012201 [Sarcophaga bullata]